MLSTDNFSTPTVPMCTLKTGECATVRAIIAPGSIRRRLQDIGLIPGTEIRCVGRSPLGDPAAYRIRGAVIALRAEDCRGILVEA